MEIKDLIAQIPAAILIFLNAVLAIQLKRQTVVTSEYRILQDTCITLRAENRELHQEIGKLKERTDLQPIIEALRDHNRESNARFDKAMEIQAQQSHLLDVNTKAIEGLTRSHERLMLKLLPDR